MYQRNHYRNKKPNSGKRISRKILLSFFAFILVLLLIYSVDLFIYRGKIYPNVLAMNQEIGKMNQEQARQLLYPVVEKMISNPLTIEHDSLKISVTPKEELGASVDIEQLVQKAYSVARGGTILNRLKERVYLIRTDYNLSDFLLFNKNSFEDFYTQLQSQIEQIPRDALLASGRIIPSQIGLRIDRQELLVGLYKSIIDSVNTDSSNTILLPVHVQQPDLPTSELLAQIGIQQILSTFETSLQGKEENTLFNIQKASHQINGILLSPGENFSFNRFIGTADKEDGYKESTIIANGQFVDGYGGGVCQVSTTLYNAALLANLQIIERYNHSIYGDATSYVPLGRDAAIFYGYKDLKFRNSLDQRIVLFCETKQNVMVVTIFGEKSLDKEIRIMTQDEKIHEYDVVEIRSENSEYSQDKVLQEGIPGYSIKTYRVIVDSDGERMEFISDDQYVSVPRKILVD